MFNAEFFVTLSFLAFVGLAIYLGLHKKVGQTLDDRADKIKEELAEAQRLRREAADVLASFERKRSAAETEAASIVDQARAEAELIAKEAEERLEEFVRRRTAQAETKIATAETQALAEVRSSAADAAAKAAAIVLKDQTKTGLADRLIEQAIGDVKRLAH